MKKNRRKKASCLNCGYTLAKNFDYCPKCGQENNDRQISFRQLISEFFSNYFSLDSRFGRSVKPFFLQPGRLTQAFMEGKRVSFANPIRLYLVISLVHFFFLSLTGSLEADSDNNIITIEESEDSSDSSRSVEFLIPDEEWQKIGEMTRDRAADHSVDEIAAAINNEEKPALTRYIVRQVIKVMKTDGSSINAYILQKIPLVMFFLLPVYALLLKLFFYRRLYINHLVHSLHLHSFAFMTFTLMWIFSLMVSDFVSRFGIFFLLLVVLYLIISFRNTYQIKYLTAVFKVSFSGLCYMITLVIGLVLGVIISLLFY